MLIFRWIQSFENFCFVEEVLLAQGIAGHLIAND
jgi:hypothetical protein